jgi:ubiquinone/menaquinone biosynthesis C-methylase UbiE
MNTTDDFPSLYGELAEWWPLLSSPEEYEEESRFFQKVLQSASIHPPKTLLELGSGGGNNASHLKAHFEMTLVDIAPGMLKVSKQLNPELEHVQGDMRSVRLGRAFDAVFIHDAITYMRTETELSQAIETAYDHCKPGGAALFVPDHTRETFIEGSDHGGHNRGARSMRYLEWSWDPDPSDSTVMYYMVYLLRQGVDDVRCVLDRHILGLFSHHDWLRMITEAGFQAQAIPVEHSAFEPGCASHVFLGIKVADG